MAKPRIPKEVIRCTWAAESPNLEYHDAEWGIPVHEDRVLFEFLILEGAQAGLSWTTILKKRENYRAAFCQFDPARVAEFRQPECDALVLNPGIVRHRQKIASAVKNAQAFLKIQAEYKSFDQYVWAFVDHTPKVNSWKSLSEIPTSTAESDALSKDLKRRGFGFVGTTICYSFMQAVGMVNDHLVDCFRRSNS